MSANLKDELQVRLNKIVRTEKFRKYVLSYTDFIPNDFNIQLVINENGEIDKFEFAIIHYGYEDSWNKGLSIYNDLSDYWTAPNDPVISDELKEAATKYIHENIHEISDVLIQFKQ